MKVVRSQLRSLVRQQEDETGKRISIRSIARATGVNEYTVRGLYNNTLSEYPGKAIAALCMHFACDLSDLLTLVDAPEAPSE